MAIDSTKLFRPFQTTRWSLVERAGDANTQVKRQALNELLIAYVPAIKSHLIRKKRVRLDDVDDIVQGFVTSQIIEKKFIVQAEQERGRFRTFLLTALDRYVISEHRRRSAKKRSGGQMTDLDTIAEPAANDEAADRVFEIEWARSVLRQTLDKMQQECHISGRGDIWGLFECRLLGPILEQRPASPYEQLVKRFGLLSPSHASNLLVTGKRMFARILRSIIAEYTAEPDQIEIEIAELMNILSVKGA